MDAVRIEVVQQQIGSPDIRIAPEPRPDVRNDPSIAGIEPFLLPGDVRSARRPQPDVPVLQLTQHFEQHEVGIVPIGPFRTRAIGCVDVVPVDPLELQVGVDRIDGRPGGFEIGEPVGDIVRDTGGVAAGEPEGTEE